MAHDVLARSLRAVLLAAVHRVCSGVPLYVLADRRLVHATAGAAASLAVRSLIFLHNVLESLLVEIAARLVLV